MEIGVRRRRQFRRGRFFSLDRSRLWRRVGFNTESTEGTEKSGIRPARKRGAGKAAAELPHSKLGDGMAVVGGIAAGGVVFELAFDVG